MNLPALLYSLPQTGVSARAMDCRFRGRSVIAYLAVSFLLAGSVSAQKTSEVQPETIRTLVEQLKADPRGPFQGIRWFCPDGSVLAATDRCPETGGFQHGLPRTDVERLRGTNHLYLGQVLAATPYPEFLDEQHAFSRLKQYQIERFLMRSDDGWIFRRARFYRGAFQAEDEEAWGRKFLVWMLSRSDLVRTRFFLLRESVRDVPHGESSNLVQRIRARSKEISDAYPAFLDVRVKLHGQPEPQDTARVSAFGKNHSDRMPREFLEKLEALQRDLHEQYAADPLNRILALAKGLPEGVETGQRIAALKAGSPRNLLVGLADAAVAARRDIEQSESGRDRLRLMDISLEVEALAFRTSGAWRPSNLGDLLHKFEVLTRLALGSGLLEWWEVAEVDLKRHDVSMPFDTFERVAARAERVVGWGIGMVSAIYEDEVARYQAFEPLAAGFLDDRMRSTALLAMGETAGRLAAEEGLRSGRMSQMMGLPREGGIRGLNPGIAVGELVVLSGQTDDVDFRANAIYLLDRAPADLKPVAGIATVSEGNLVSHVQLLARNLGIPNAVISPDILRDLFPYSGQRVFYAVSPRGVVLMKSEAEMRPDERELIEHRKRSDERIRVPTSRVDLTSTILESLHNLRAGDSGRICGPKAANLGQLTTLFPESVASGFIIPFGVFKQHMDQTIPGRSETYWQRLEGIFQTVEEAREAGKPESVIEEGVLSGLASLRSEIERMPFKEPFVASLRSRFVDVLGGALGKVPVFVRSDTNMEDLKDFTGAGLNLTVPNVLSEADVLQAIRRVWASPYRERGYRWRQKYLLNPQDVYPSLLILTSVNADESGVMITTGISSGVPDHYTVAFNRGVGGAVDGQAAETYDLSPGGGAELLAPARESEATILPPTGGIRRVPVAFDERILTPGKLEALLATGSRIRRALPGTPGIETNGPFDVELGLIDGRIWLFQTRPFVENRSAVQSTYLSKMDVRDGLRGQVSMTEPLQTPR